MGTQLTITVISPITHGDFKNIYAGGNILSFRRMPMICGNRRIDVPVISGNSIRAIMRRYLTREFITALNLNELLSQSAFDRLYRVMAGGGFLEKDMERAISPNRISETRKLLPPLSCFGAAMYRYMLSGVVNVGFAVLQCKELETGDMLIPELIEDVTLTRLPVASGDSPMIYTTECVIPGAQFRIEISFASTATPLEISCIMHGLNTLTALGGQTSAGFGKVSVAPTNLDDSRYINWLENTAHGRISEIIKFAEEL